MKNSNISSSVIQECLRIEEDCQHSAKGHFEASASWGVCHNVLGGVTAIVTAIAAGLAFNQFTQAAAICAMISTGLTAVLTFLNPSKKQSSHLKSGNEYNSIKNDSRILREVESKIIEGSLQIERLKSLSSRRDRLNEISLQIPRFAFTKAKAGIDRGESDYRADGSQD
jgi:hypothetical protein